ncbi:hypothetical protein PG990_000329 [Apiospora arundinis]
MYILRIRSAAPSAVRSFKATFCISAGPQDTRFATQSVGGGRQQVATTLMQGNNNTVSAIVHPWSAILRRRSLPIGFTAWSDNMG